MAKISIIIPVYNVPRKFLIKCINSVIKQTYKDIEIVIVDDGSGDECSALCDEFKGKDNRINVVHKKNGGLSDARNVGVQNTNSDWFMFLDGDDWIEEDVWCHAPSFLYRLPGSQPVLPSCRLWLWNPASPRRTPVL